MQQQIFYLAWINNPHEWKKEHISDAFKIFSSRGKRIYWNLICQAHFPYLPFQTLSHSLISLSRGWGDEDRGMRTASCRLLVALPAPPASLPFPSASQPSPGIHELQFNSSALEFQQTRSRRERRERRAPREEGPWVNISERITCPHIHQPN